MDGTADDAVVGCVVLFVAFVFALAVVGAVAIYSMFGSGDK